MILNIRELPKCTLYWHKLFAINVVYVEEGANSQKLGARKA